MRLSNLFSSIPMHLNNAQDAVVKKIGNGLFCADKFSQSDLHVAEELFYKGILKKTTKNDILYFYIQPKELDREPLHDR